MKHRLTGAGAGIDHSAIAGFRQSLLIRDPRGDAQQVAQQMFMLLRTFIQRLQMFNRNHEEVGWGLRIYVTNDYRAIVAVHEVRGNLIRYHATE
jgi:hypothetical protein